MPDKIDFFSSDLNGNGKTGFFERMLGLDPGIRAVAGVWRGATGRNQAPQKAFWEHAYPSRTIQRQGFGTSQNPWQVNDFTNSFSAPQGGLSYGKTDPWSNPYKRQDFSLSAPQPQYGQAQAKDMFDPNGLTQFSNTGLPMGNMPQAPRITPQQMPVRNDLDFLNTTGSAYQSRYNPMQTGSAVQNAGGYLDPNNVGTVGGNWVNGAGWYTMADKASGTSKEDLLIAAEEARRLSKMNQ